MARKPRIHYPGAFYHVILRGNAGKDIFFTKKDRSLFFILLQEGMEKYGHCIHAYCLMTNHVHLVIQVGDIPLSRIMQNVSFRYTRYINHRKNQSGHLFQGRYKALVVDADNYLLELVRYIHNNPVRAGLVKAAAEYPWSSHTVYLGEDSVPWLTTDFVLAQFALLKSSAVVLYRDFVLQGHEETHRKELQQGNFEGRILGEGSFAKDALARASQKMNVNISIEQILQAVCEKYGVELRDLSGRGRQGVVSEARATAAFLVREAEGINLVDLGQMVNRDLSGLSQGAGRLEKRMKSDRKLREKVNKLQKRCANTN